MSVATLRPAALPATAVRLLARREVAAGTLEFRLTRPPGFRFRAGQWISLALREPPAEPNSAQRTFSLASAPGDAQLAVATRMREASAYKRALGALPEGAALALRGPRGTMTLHEDDDAREAVLIAGGIGITPFMSMLREAASGGAARPLRLAYCARRPDDAPYLAELDALARTLPGLRMLARMTDTQGFLDAQALCDLVDATGTARYFLAGPPAMVEAARGVLRDLRVRDADVRSEQFFGY